jgi:excisionase family DNA binding protein
MAMGFAMAQQMMQQPGGIAGTPPPLPAQNTAASPELLAPADAAKILNVSEADVLASIQSGDLKAKKIGAQFRITRAALDEFLKS